MSKSTILAAIGQLPHDNSVLLRALELSEGDDSHLHVVHVLDLPGEPSDLDDMSTFLGQGALAARDRISSTLREMGADAASVEIKITTGAHALSLIEICRELAPDLIVMRAHQRKKMSEKILGSTTERVIAAADTPVLVVKNQADAPYKRAVLATNGTDDALERLQFATRHLPNANFQLVQVVQIPRQLREAMMRTGAGKAALADHREHLMLGAEMHLRELLREGGLTTIPIVFNGDPSKTLTDFCESREVDLIAIGQGRSNLVTRAFIGSVSRRLLRDVTSDILIC